MKKLIVSVFIVMSLLLSTSGIHAYQEGIIIEVGAERDNAPSGVQYISYTIKAGDSLYKISRMYGVSIESIMELNNIDSYLIYPGQILQIAVNVPDNDNIIYIVRSGDSLYFISKRYNISIDSIKRTNNLNSDLIFIGQRLEIPADEDGEAGKGPDIFYSADGKIVLNNRTEGSAVSAQEESGFNNRVFPLKEDKTEIKYQENEMIVKYKPMIGSQAVEELEKENDLVNISTVNRPEGIIARYQIPEDRELEELLQEYREKENVLWAEPNYIYYPAVVPNDRYYRNYQWNMVNVNMEAAWELNRGDNTVVVAVLDTGIIPGHPDLKENLLPGVDFVGGGKSYSVRSYNPTDYDPTDETPYEKGGSHGTHVAGIIGAVTNNKMGVAGMNWNVKILPVRVLTRSGGTSWDIAEGIYYAIDQGVNIINMSFGSNSDSYYQREAIREAVSKGITVIAAAGNEGSSVYYPAAYPETIAVSAVGRKNTKTAYSNYGPEVDIAAPGGDYGESIISTWGYYQNGNAVADYNGMIGTSMAAPHVSGAAALLAASGITDPEEIRSRLLNTAREPVEKGRDDYYGSGLLDVYGALLNKRIEEPVVFAAEKSGSLLWVKSEFQKAEDSSFSLKRIEPSADIIAAWFDSNDNGLIDSGDYYGESVYSKTKEGYEINMWYLSRDDSSFYYQVIK
ncbi:MAG: S8 family serine peptidase [Halanaerobiaceae bacterium]|nr:S8 family serine peptidase [Halanaerobiaceae bacterium]